MFTIVFYHIFCYGEDRVIYFFFTIFLHAFYKPSAIFTNQPLIFTNQTVIFTNRTVILKNQTQKITVQFVKIKQKNWEEKIYQPNLPITKNMMKIGSKHEVIYWNSP